jgi:hypothetical protein
MFQSQIVSLVPDGEFDTAYGHMYAFMATLADGQVGSVNAKTQVPPYGVGHTVAYDITGERNGVAKLKIDAHPKPETVFAQRVQPIGAVIQPVAPQPIPAIPRPLVAPATPPKPIPPVLRNGQTVGMAVKLAGDIIMHNQRAKAEPVDLPHLSRDLVAIAEAVMEASHSLETKTPLIDSDVPF